MTVAVSDAVVAEVTPLPHPRTLVLVAGSGRSGTSLFSGLLQRLGFLVPTPEVPADETNPKGFAESQWVVDFHTRLLALAGVQTADARPAAWALTAATCLDADVRNVLRTWLEEQFAASPDVVVKDPRLSWFLPLWRRVAEDAGAEAKVVTMLRHPAAVIDSKERYYGGRQGEAGRAAGWVNQLLFTERATRGAARAFVRYDELLADWTPVVGGVGEALDLAAVRDADARAIRRAHEFVDARLRRSRESWDDLLVPEPLRAQADAAWDVLTGIADGREDAAAHERLDALRADYTGYYALAESVAYSSVRAAQGQAERVRRPSLPRPLLAIWRRVPVGARRVLPQGMRGPLLRVMVRRPRAVNNL